MIRTGEMLIPMIIIVAAFIGSIIVLVNFDIDATTGVIILRCEIIASLIISIFNILHLLIKTNKHNMYSYKIMYYIGTLVFNVIVLLIFIFIVVEEKEEINSLNIIIKELAYTGQYFLYVVMPVVLLFSIFLVVSNIILIINEGFSYKNLLGTVVGGFLIFAIFLPIFIEIVTPSLRDISFLFTSGSIALLAYFISNMIGSFFGTLIAGRRVPPFDRDYIIILGCGLRDDGTPTPLLKNRIDRAIWFSERQFNKIGRDICFVCSGGQGEDEIITEAESMKNYLIEQGIRQQHILMEDNSDSTFNNMKYSVKVILENEKKMNRDNYPKIAFSTDDYHVFRSGNIAYRMGVKAVGVGCRTKWYFYFNAFIREFAANLKTQRWKHVFNVILIVLISIMLYTIYNVT
ncbi:MAG: YdcF family protein [Lachnospiraceae bacterium]|nr:YdcF family protein [Lachnospiraceae bacterium]